MLGLTWRCRWGCARLEVMQLVILGFGLLGLTATGSPSMPSGARRSLRQRQLVCLARAMLADPQILLLDEATSSVDVFTEQRIQEALAMLLKGRTSFVVALRLSTIRGADLVLSS